MYVHKIYLLKKEKLNHAKFLELIKAQEMKEKLDKIAKKIMN